jgi:hypothetical protein
MLTPELESYEQILSNLNHLPESDLSNKLNLWKGVRHLKLDRIIL